MRSIKFDQLGRKAPAPAADAAVAVGAALVARALAEAERVTVRPANGAPHPAVDSDAVVSAGSRKP